MMSYIRTRSIHNLIIYVFFNSPPYLLVHKRYRILHYELQMGIVLRLQCQMRNNDTEQVTPGQAINKNIYLLYVLFVVRGRTCLPLHPLPEV